MHDLRLPFAISLLLHLSVMAGIRIRLPERTPLPVTMQARLLPPVPAIRDVGEPLVAVGPSGAPGPAGRRPVGERAHGARAPVPVAAASEAPVLPAGGLSTEAILAAAREIGRADETAAVAEAAKRRGSQRPEPALLDRPLQPALAKALAGDGSGMRITRFANGMIKVTTAAGTTYCLFTPPSIVQGALPQTSVAVTCP